MNKVILIASVCFALTYGQNVNITDPAVLKSLRSCVKQYDVKEDDFSDPFNKWSSHDRGCLVSCIYKEANMLDSNGKLIEEKLEQCDDLKLKQANKFCKKKYFHCELGECLYHYYNYY